MSLRCSGSLDVTYDIFYGQFGYCLVNLDDCFREFANELVEVLYCNSIVWVVYCAKIIMQTQSEWRLDKHTFQPLTVIVDFDFLEKQHRVWMDGTLGVWCIASITRLGLLNDQLRPWLKLCARLPQLLFIGLFLVYRNCSLLQPALGVAFVEAGSSSLASSSGSDSEAASLSLCASKSDASPDSALPSEPAALEAASESVSGSTYDFRDVALALLEALLGVSAATRFIVLRDAFSRVVSLILAAFSSTNVMC